MLVRIRKAQEGIVQGVSLSHLFPGLTYDLDSTLAGYLVSLGAAEPVSSNSASPVVPVSAHEAEDFLERPLGGISVSRIAEAADASRRKRRSRKGTR